MDYFAETSFLFAIYIAQDNSDAADKTLANLNPGTPLSMLVRFEFENSLQLQAGLFDRDRSQGLAPRFAQAAKETFSADVACHFWEIKSPDLAAILNEAQYLSDRHTQQDLQRPMDILHVATALHWGAREFLTFDVRQARLAKAAGLKCPLKVR
jgi:predicted nucleic acid-binding protein